MQYFVDCSYLSNSGKIRLTKVIGSIKCMELKSTIKKY